MVKTKIGIKYCGGCNPKYERVEMIQRLQSMVGEQFLFVRHDQQDLDGLITVNGCLRACAAKGLNQTEVSYHSVVKNNDFDSLMEWLLTFEHERTKR